MASVEQPVTAELAIVSEEPTGAACQASAFAVVDDLADAAEYRVTYTDTYAPDREYVVTFNRHERGNLHRSQVPTFSAGSGKITALLAWVGQANATGDNCAAARALAQELCRNLEWQIASAVKKVTFTVRKSTVRKS